MNQTLYFSRSNHVYFCTSVLLSTMPTTKHAIPGIFLPLSKFCVMCQRFRALQPLCNWHGNSKRGDCFVGVYCLLNLKPRVPVVLLGHTAFFLFMLSGKWSGHVRLGYQVCSFHLLHSMTDGPMAMYIQLHTNQKCCSARIRAAQYYILYGGCITL